MGVALRLVAVFALVAAALGGCDDPCGNSPLGEAVSPDGRTVAMAFERDCGATTGFVRIVALRRAGETIDFSRRDNWALTLKGRPDVVLRWAGPAALDIELSGEKEVFVETPRWKDIAITRR